MSDTPAPNPMTDEEADDLDYLHENYERDLAYERWGSALEWARKGDFTSLVECLRFEGAGPPEDPVALRNFLADVLEGKFQKPRNSKAKRFHEKVQFVDIDGRCLAIEKRHLPQATIIKRIKEMQRDHGLSVRQAVAVVAKETDVEEETVAQYMRNPRRSWGLSQRTAEEMFSGIVPLKE